MKYWRTKVDDPWQSERVYWEFQLEDGMAWQDENQAIVIPSRLDHAKSRQHTRHWEGEGAGTKALNPQYAVDINRWKENIKESLTPRLRNILTKAARKAAKDMVEMGVANAMHARGQGDARSRSALGRVFGSTQQAETALDGVLRPLEDVMTAAAERQARRVMDRIEEMDREGASMSQIQKEVRQMIGARSEWRRALATNLTTGLINGGTEVVWSQAGNLVKKRWNTREDERVRATHRRLDGREIRVDKRFRVGKWWMKRPGDPMGGPEETINCRCFLTFDVNPAMGDYYDRHSTPQRKDVYSSLATHAVGVGVGTVVQAEGITARAHRLALRSPRKKRKRKKETTA